MGRKFPALLASHPLVRDAVPCTACWKPFVEGDETTLVILGPGDDQEAQQRRDEGRAYNAAAAVVHWACSEQKDNA